MPLFYYILYYLISVLFFEFGSVVDDHGLRYKLIVLTDMSMFENEGRNYTYLYLLLY